MSSSVPTGTARMAAAPARAMVVADPVVPAGTAPAVTVVGMAVRAEVGQAEGDADTAYLDLDKTELNQAWGR
ncbi:hypothetical protein ACQP1U_16675 [Actinomycetota bacterium]